MAAAIQAALANHTGDILAFLPGMGEIRRTEQALAGCGALVLPLHGDLPPAEQDRALTPAAGRRVVLATSIAETSLTVPGVRIVIDGGWRRTPRLDPATGLTRLETVRISRAAADQRAGRAGREAPGVAIRLWTTALHRGLAPFDRPQIFEAELAGLALDCAAWGAAPADLPFPDPPPAGALAAAGALLRMLGALDGDGRITQPGRRMAQLGAHPRLAAMMLAAPDPGAAALAADLAALLEERDPLRAGAGATASVDVATRLAAIAHGAAEADRGALSRIRQAATQYCRRLGTRATPDGDPGALLAAAFPDRIAQRRGEPGSFRLSGGGGARLSQADKLSQARLLVVASLEQKASAQITLAAELDPANLPPAIAALTTESVESGYDQATGAVFSRRRRRYGALVLEDRMVPRRPGRHRRHPRRRVRRETGRAALDAGCAPAAGPRCPAAPAGPWLPGHLGRNTGRRRAGLARPASARPLPPDRCGTPGHHRHPAPATRLGRRRPPGPRTPHPPGPAGRPRQHRL